MYTKEHWQNFYLNPSIPEELEKLNYLIVSLIVAGAVSIIGYRMISCVKMCEDVVKKIHSDEDSESEVVEKVPDQAESEVVDKVHDHDDFNVIEHKHDDSEKETVQDYYYSEVIELVQEHSHSEVMEKVQDHNDSDSEAVEMIHHHHDFLRC